MKEYILDINYLLRFLLKDDPTLSEISRKTFEGAKSRKFKIEIPLVVFIEANYALIKFYRLPKSEVVDKLMMTLNLPFIVIEKRDVLLAALILYGRTNFSLTDLILLTQAEKEGKELLTFDQRLKKLSTAL